MALNLEKARYNMVEQQIRTWDVLDQRVLDLVAASPRDQYVPAAFKKLAYADMSIPLGEGEVMMPPREEARMVQALDVQPEDYVLEVGTGSGYVTALLAQLARRVTSVEISRRLKQQAESKLADHHHHNVTVELGDAVKGWGGKAPYDVIAVTGSMPILEEDFQRQLKLGGRLFVIVGEAPAMEARLITRVSEADWSTESLFETVIPPLIGAKHPERFVL